MRREEGLCQDRAEFVHGFVGPLTASHLYLMYNVSSFTPLRSIDARLLLRARLHWLIALHALSGLVAGALLRSRCLLTSPPPTPLLFPGARGGAGSSG